MDALGWIQKWLEVVEKQVGLSKLWIPGDREDLGGVLGQSHTGAVKHLGILGTCKGVHGGWGESWRQGEKQER